MEVSDNLFVVADLGCDTLTSYRLEGDHQLLRLSQTRCEPGAGPRHTALHPNGRFLFVLNELNSTCSSFAVDSGFRGADTDRLDEHLRIPTETIVPISKSRPTVVFTAEIVAMTAFGVQDARQWRSQNSSKRACGGKTPGETASPRLVVICFAPTRILIKISVFERNAETGNYKIPEYPSKPARQPASRHRRLRPG